MTDDIGIDIERLVTLNDDKDSGGSPEQGGAADWLGGGGTTPADTAPGDYVPGSLTDILGEDFQRGGTPTPQEMASTNASNAEARAQAIKDGMDEGTANILYPEFSTPEDMNRIN